jgi:acyl-CoA-dependent ceramide synthase
LLTRLQAAKLLRYVGFKVACDGMFVVFLLGWVCTRQVGLAMVTYSVTFKMPKFVAFQWNPAKERYMTAPVYATFVSLLVVLLILCTVWFCMAIRVALRVVRGQGAEDTRSDSEDGEEEEDEVEDDFEATNGTLNGNANGSANKSLANGNGLVKNTRSRTSSPKPIRNGTSTAHEQNGHANGSAETNGLGLKRRY